MFAKARPREGSMCLYAVTIIYWVQQLFLIQYRISNHKYILAPRMF